MSRFINFKHVNIPFIIPAFYKYDLYLSYCLTQGILFITFKSVELSKYVTECLRMKTFFFSNTFAPWRLYVINISLPHIVKLTCNIQPKYIILQRCGHVALQRCHFMLWQCCLFHNVVKITFLQFCTTLYLRCVFAGIFVTDNRPIF